MLKVRSLRFPFLILLILAIFLLGACKTVNVPTETPPPPTATEVINPTPTQEVLDQDPVNVNSSFTVRCLETEGQILQIGDRFICQPPGWIYTSRPKDESIEPNVFWKEVASDGFLRFEVSYIAGAFGLATHVDAHPGERFMVRTRYKADMKPSDGAAYNPGDLNFICRFDNLASTNATSPPQQIVINDADAEALCVFEVGGAVSRTVRVDVFMTLNWASYIGHVDVYSIEIYRVPHDQYDDAVVMLP